MITEDSRIPTSNIASARAQELSARNGKSGYFALMKDVRDLQHVLPSRKINLQTVELHLQSARVEKSLGRAAY